MRNTSTWPGGIRVQGNADPGAHVLANSGVFPTNGANFVDAGVGDFDIHLSENFDPLQWMASLQITGGFNHVCSVEFEDAAEVASDDDLHVLCFLANTGAVVDCAFWLTLVKFA